MSLNKKMNVDLSRKDKWKAYEDIKIKQGKCICKGQCGVNHHTLFRRYCPRNASKGLIVCEQCYISIQVSNGGKLDNETTN